MKTVRQATAGTCRWQVIGSAIIWAAVIAAATQVAPESFRGLLPILGGGAAAHIVILGGVRRQ